MKGLLSLYSLKYPKVLVYMLQNTEYQPGPYLKWFWRVFDFSKVIKRRQLDKTRAARLLLMVLYLGIGFQILLGGFLIIWDIANPGYQTWLAGASLLISYPVVWAHLLVVPIWLGRILIVNPKNKRLIKESKNIFANHKAVKIAVAGSYGKTTMKELLGVVLAEGKKVAITPANKNVASSHAQFASNLKGDEEVLVLEYGEGKPGDVAKFSETIQPNIGIITGIAPAHLDQYPTLEAAASDIFSLADYLKDENVFVNADSVAAKPFIKQKHSTYTSKHVGSWRVKNVKVSSSGLSFTLQKNKITLNLSSQLLGSHQVGPLAAVAVIAHQLGLSAEQIEAGIAKTKPFDHRMQPRNLNGALLIDDTYNGNIDGVRAGLQLLKDLPAKRKLYVTPGLVDQGVETEAVHLELGRLIAEANPDRVVLMENSVTKLIMQGLESANYEGQVYTESNPLEFYTNIDQFLAAGDVALLQNDWTDNYN